MVDENGYPKDVTKGISGMGLLAALYGAEKGNPLSRSVLIILDAVISLTLMALCMRMKSIQVLWLSF